jgi:hypothetical protein
LASEIAQGPRESTRDSVEADPDGNLPIRRSIVESLCLESGFLQELADPRDSKGGVSGNRSRKFTTNVSESSRPDCPQ